MYFAKPRCKWQFRKVNFKNIPDRTRIKILGDLAWNYSFIDPKKAMKFANEELKLSIKANDNTAMGQA